MRQSVNSMPQLTMIEMFERNNGIEGEKEE